MAEIAVNILAVNVGSSSLRLDWWNFPAAQPTMTLQADGIGGGDGAVSADEGPPERALLPDHAAALRALLARLPDVSGLDYIGHRLVHGGGTYRDAVRIDAKVLSDLDALVPLSPLHLPPAIQIIRQLIVLLPRVPQAAVFDTAFHATLPARAYEYAVARGWREWGVRRYGFHGLACADVVWQLAGHLKERAVLLHLGAGCSATAVLRGRSLDTTMGFTPLEGLVMATRGGDIDPGVLLFLQREHGCSPTEIDRALNYESGLLGLSGFSADMKTLLEHGDSPPAALAVEVFCYRAAKAVGALSIALGGCDQVVFSGGIGEHAAPVRAQIVGRLGTLGARLDEQANLAHLPVVSTPDSAVAIHVVRVDEGRQIARDTARLAGMDPRGGDGS